MRACEQCGLSIGQTATFCPVCGATAAPFTPPLNDPVVGSLHGAELFPDEALSRRLHQASLRMHDAGLREQTDPTHAAELYREAIVRFLEVAEDPLDREDVRRDLLLIFDRLSLVLKRSGLPAEALEEVDSAASLGLLDCQDHGIKAQREALRKRRESLRRAVERASPQS
jgi:hypothetical protein